MNNNFKKNIFVTAVTVTGGLCASMTMSAIVKKYIPEPTGIAQKIVFAVGTAVICDFIIEEVAEEKLKEHAESLWDVKEILKNIKGSSKENNNGGN